MAVIRGRGSCAGIPTFNDAPRTTHKDVLAVIRAARRLARQQVVAAGGAGGADGAS